MTDTAGDHHGPPTLARIADTLCVHGGAAQVMPELRNPLADPSDPDPLVLALAAHRTGTGVYVGNDSHESPVDEYVFLLTLEDAAMTVAWITGAMFYGGQLPMFKEATSEAITQVKAAMRNGTRPMFRTAPVSSVEPTPGTGGYL